MNNVERYYYYYINVYAVSLSSIRTASHNPPNKKKYNTKTPTVCKRNIDLYFSLFHPE